MRYLEELKRLIFEQTDKVGSPIANIYGTAQAPLSGLTGSVTSTWLALTVPGRNISTIDGFYATFLGFANPTRLLSTQDGTVVWNDASTTTTTTLLRGTVELTGPRSFSLAVQTGDMQAAYVLHVNGTVAQQGFGGGELGLTLPPGSHIIEVLASSSTLGLKVPADLVVRGDFERVPTPVWQLVRTGYADPAQAQATAVLEWFADSRAGGWRILRRQLQTVSGIVDVGTVDGNSEFSVTLSGDQSALLVSGQELNAVHERMGTVLQFQFDDINTIVRLRLALGRDVPNVFWVGALATQGTFAEIQRIGQTQTSGVVTWTDVNVVRERLYDYALQAWGFLNTGVWSTQSDIKSIRIGDRTPPRSITYISGYPRVVNRRAFVRFFTPTDTDYAGVRTYYRKKFTQIGTVGGSLTSLTDTGANFTGVDSTWKVRITAGTGVNQERNVLSLTGVTQINTANDWITAPDSSSSYLVFKDRVLLTDYGLPSTTALNLKGTATSGAAGSITDSGANFSVVDTTWMVVITGGTGVAQYRAVASLTGVTQINVTPNWTVTPSTDSTYTVYKGTEDQFDFEPIDTAPSAPTQEYQFRAFDQGFNEQEDTLAATWTYNPAADGSWTVPPLITIRQVPTSEQLLFSAPYNNTTNWALVELAANDPADRLVGVTVFYQRRSDAAPISFPATTAPSTEGGTPRILDDPIGTRSRYIAIDRTTDQNWVRVWATDGDGNRSDKITYSVDYDDQAEIASIEARLDTFAQFNTDWNGAGTGNEFGSGVFAPAGQSGMIRVTGAVDDDCRSLRYYFEDGLGDDPYCFGRDLFTDIDNVLLETHVATFGGPWIKHASFSSGSVQTSDAGRVHTTTGNDVLYYMSGLPLTADYDVSCIVRQRSATNENAGAVGRVQAGAITFYSARYNDNSDQWELLKKVAGATTILGTYVQVLTTDRDYHVRLEMRGTAIKMFVDSVQRASVTDSAITLAGTAGVLFEGSAGSDTTGLHLDDLMAGIGRVMDLSTTRSFAFATSLYDGERKNLVMEPWSSDTATCPGIKGLMVQREFARSPRSTAGFDSYDENNNATGQRVRARFDMFPAAVQVYPASGTSAVSAASNGPPVTLDVAGSPWIAGQYASTGRAKFYVISTAVTANANPELLETKGQIRKIVTNTTGQLQVTPAWTTVPTGGQFYIVDGAVLLKYDGSSNFKPTSGVQYFDRKTDASSQIEYYATKNKCPDEGIHRSTVDADTIPAFDDVSVVEVTPNLIRLTAINPDDDVKYWRVYRRKGAVPASWGGTILIPNTGALSMSVTTGPSKYVRTTGSFLTDGFQVGMTINATSFSNAANNGLSVITAVVALEITVTKVGGTATEGAAAGKNLTTALQGSDFQRQYLHHGPIEVGQLTYDSYGGTGTQFIATVPSNALNQDGPPILKTMIVIGVAATPSLSNLSVVPVDGGGPSGYNNRIKWQHPNITGPGSGGNGSATHKTKIFAKRRNFFTGVYDILESEITTSFDPRYVPIDNPDYDNTGDTDTIANEGSFIHNNLAQRGAGSMFTWNYRVELWDTAGPTKQSEYTIEHSDLYLPPAVNVISASLYAFGGTGSGNQCHAPPYNRVFWGINADYAGYSIAIELSTAANPSGGSWALVASGLAPGEQQWQHDFQTFYASAGSTKNYTYRVWAYKTTDGPSVVQGSKWYTINGSSTGSTSAPATPADSYQFRVCTGGYF